MRREIRDLLDGGMSKKDIINAYDGLPEQKQVAGLIDDHVPGGIYVDTNMADMDKTIKYWGDRENALGFYENLLGEREARDTARRLGLSLDERRNVLPDLGEGAHVIMRGLSQ
jgi:hypothetical protein